MASEKGSNKQRKAEQKRHHHSEFKSGVKPQSRPWTNKHQEIDQKKFVRKKK